LKEFYRMLMESEARHFMTFLKFAKKYSSKIDVDKRWLTFLEFEASLMTKYGKEQTMHG
jgi:tRNA-(ms[2]io[6]A)-hydroxylase